MIWATVSSWSCFCWLYRASPSLATKNIINLISVLATWWCLCVESSLVLLEEGVCYDHWRTDWFQIGKGVRQGCILSLCLFNLYAEYFMWNARLDKAQAGINIAGRNINNLRYTDDTTLMAESKEPLDESERGEWKSWLKAQHSEN